MRQANIKLANKFYANKRKTIDSLANKSWVNYSKRTDILMDVMNAWSSLQEFRDMAERYARYTFGDQWSDKVNTTKGIMTERKNILRQGNIPLQNNRIRGIVRSVVGVFQSQQTEPVCLSRDRDKQIKGEMMSNTIQYIYQLNKLWGLDSSCLNDFLVTGIGAFKSTYGWRQGKMDVWTDKVNYNRIFFDNHMLDPRHWDCHLIGELHDVSLYDVMSQFSDGSPERADEIRDIYSGCTTEMTISYLENLTDSNNASLDFMSPVDETRCRVIEVWKKESKERYLCHDTLTAEYYKIDLDSLPSILLENERRKGKQMQMGVEESDMRLIEYTWFIDSYWYYYYLSPMGDVLKEGETPFWHGSHPYSFKIYPFFNGQAFPFVGDFIDQQRYINRLITLNDFMIRSSAKGVLAIDEQAIPEGWTEQDYIDEWTSYNGVILYTSKAGAKLPQQIVSSSTNLGLTDMLSIQLKLLEDISGVQGALQGQQAKSGTPASLYMQQVQNSATSLTELFEAFRELREERDTKNMKLAQQYYKEPKYVGLTGRDAYSESMIYNPELVRNAEMELNITEGTSSPAYRMVMNDFLMQMFQSQQISIKELLQNGSFPFADKLLQSIEAREEELQQGGMGGVPLENVVPNDISQAVRNNTNPMVQKIMNNKEG